MSRVVIPELYWTGRLFDYHVLDMAELGILNFSSRTQFKAGGCVLGSKPCMLFSGDLFETDFNYIRLKNLFIGTVCSGSIIIPSWDHGWSCKTDKCSPEVFFCQIFSVVLKCQRFAWEAWIMS